jgi:hypothetical protein
MAAAPDATQEATLVPDHIQKVSSATLPQLNASSRIRLDANAIIDG